MPNLRIAATQALEVLEQLQGGCTDSDDGTVEVITVWCPEVIDTLRAALAQQDAQTNHCPTCKRTDGDMCDWCPSMQQDAQAVPQGWRVERVSDDDVRVYGPDAETWLLRANPGKGTFEDFAHRFCFALASCPQPSSDAQAVPQWANAAFTEIAGCFDAAIAEGLLDALAETRDERLKDLVVRRLMYAHAVAAQAAAPTPPAQRVTLTDEEIERIYTEETGSFIDDSPWALKDFARAIIEAYERKNGIK